MPNYVKFMKDILNKKRNFGEFETVALSEECNAIIQKKLPRKLMDRESFIISCATGEKFYGKALCDLCVSINLMRLPIFKKPGLGDVDLTTITLQLADQSITYLRGL
ncbi:uncharacterized protein LOC110021057 [Phalaenopsis equestris]|uniref:uncharacterized protein LOC110021057 n=1 Tax=Phalaenopsis equestris TaxID=78828 RepID=UPI0009E5D422|nr:uncharacterized protein LOC110021057 [Phalaenopsis equestris]